MSVIWQVDLWEDLCKQLDVFCVRMYVQCVLCMYVQYVLCMYIHTAQLLLICIYTCAFCTSCQITLYHVYRLQFFRLKTNN